MRWIYTMLQRRYIGWRRLWRVCLESSVFGCKKKNHIIWNDRDDDDDSDVRGLILSRYSIDQEATGLQPTTARTIEIDAHMHRFQRYAQRARATARKKRRKPGNRYYIHRPSRRRLTIGSSFSSIARLMFVMMNRCWRVVVRDLTACHVLIA